MVKEKPRSRRGSGTKEDGRGTLRRRENNGPVNNEKVETWTEEQSELEPRGGEKRNRQEKTDRREADGTEARGSAFDSEQRVKKSG